MIQEIFYFNTKLSLVGTHWNHITEAGDSNEYPQGMFWWKKNENKIVNSYYHKLQGTRILGLRFIRVYHNLSITLLLGSEANSSY